MKRIAALVIMLVIITGVMAFAEENIKVFTYESALEAAVKNSIQPALDELNIKSKESALEQAKEDAIEGFIGGTSQEVVERTFIREVAPMEAEVAVEVARREKIDHEKQLKADVYQEMMRYLLARDSVELKKERISLLEVKYGINLIQFEKGLIAETEITNEKLELSVEDLDLTKMETSLKSDILNIKHRLHIDLSDENQIAFDNKLQKVGTHYVMDFFNLEKAIEKAVAENTEVYAGQKALEAAQKRMEITQKYLKPGNDFYDKKLYELEAAEKELYDKKVSLEVSIRNAYNDLLTASDTLELANKKLDLENNRLAELQVKFDAGMVSRKDMIDTEINVVSRKQEVLQAVCDFNIKNDALRNLLGD